VTRDDDARTFARIYDEHRTAVHAYFLGRTSDPEIAADLMQETFLRTWRRLPEVADLDDDRRRAWIFTVARNLTIDTYRSRATAKATQAALQRSAPTAAPDHEQPDSQAELAEHVAALDKAIAALPDKLRTTLTMHAAGGMNSAQIAKALGEPAGTIRYRLSQARQRLAATLSTVEA
jgi:RNA polymerase sigma-70 factor (ECF subfamily)